MNYKETLKKLHEVFPDFDTDTLLKILDCYVSDSTTLQPDNWNIRPLVSPPKPWDSITYYTNTISSR